jgi:cytochrome P450
MATQATDLVTEPSRVRAILADPEYRVPPAPSVPAEESGTLAWLRAHVARFCDGEVHDRRRELVEQELAKLDPSQLRAAATARAREELDRAGDEPFDAMGMARRVPVAVLAGALGLAAEATGRAVDAVLASASGYPNPDLAGPDADAGVGFLAEVLSAGDRGPTGPQEVANRIGLLEQACDATAALIGNALITAFTDPADAGTGTGTGTSSTDEIIAATLVTDPPVQRTRRLTPDGEPVKLDITSCTFGAGRRPCPGADQATALAAGVLDALLGACELADQQLSYLPSPNLRMPQQLLVTTR